MASKLHSSAPANSRGPADSNADADADADAFTPERFERELKALAAKAKEDTPAKYWVEQASLYLGSALLLVLMALFSNVSQLALSPVYGSISASRWHSQLVATACFTGWASNMHLRRRLPFQSYLLLPVVALWIPALQFYLYQASGFLAQLGPLVTELLTLFPLVALSAACVANMVEEVDLAYLPRWLAESAPGISSFTFLKAVERLSAGWLDAHMGRTVLCTRVGLESLLGLSYTLLTPSPRLLLFALPGVLHTVLWNTHAPTPWALARLNDTLLHGPAAHRPDVGAWMILDRRESLTGYVSVLESVTMGYRVMRCDHSLLGGEWVNFEGMENTKANQVAEPIFSVFIMLEAVRLVERPNPVPDSKAKALNIGLGIGTTPAALVAHGIHTTVVEIDPVVHEFASKYFRLPQNHTAVIEDAVTYAARLAAIDERDGGERFDYIVHDVFTGGAEPIALFTLEFLQDLATLLQPSGVIAINYAGDLSHPSPTVVLQTIARVFPTCRIFREHERDEAEVEQKGGQDFTNMVVFCTKQQQPASRGGLTFRAPTTRDLLNSPTRRAYIPPKPDNELRLDVDLTLGRDEGILTRNDTQKLARWHAESALGHWGLMRKVLPAVVWENW